MTPHGRYSGLRHAGTYVFKILDSQSDRHIVQIFDEKETTVYATLLAIPNYRLKSTDKTVITFSERPAGQPEALRAWFYPGRQWGEALTVILLTEPSGTSTARRFLVQLDRSQCVGDPLAGRREAIVLLPTDQRYIASRNDAGSKLMEIRSRSCVFSRED